MTEAAPPALRLTAIVPTFRRGRVLLDTLEALAALERGADEILVVDQTPEAEREPADRAALEALAAAGTIRWLHRHPPSIPGAMNAGLLAATGDVVLYLDDDVLPHADLVAAHRQAHAQGEAAVVAGRVLQPWDGDAGPPVGGAFSFAQTTPAWIEEFMAGNVSLRRDALRGVGGFDERFHHVAYRFEAEAAHRLRRAGHRIRFEPRATLRHLKAERGGTRSYGGHLTTWRPSHAVGAYYYLLRVRPAGWWRTLLARPLRSVRTRHHLRRPWWIPVTLLSEVLGLLWAVPLALAGPRLLRPAAAREVGA